MDSQPAELIPDPVEVNVLVQVNSQAKGIVTEIDVPEEEIENYKDKVKFIYGKVQEKPEPALEETPAEENGGNEECQNKPQ